MPVQSRGGGGKVLEKCSLIASPSRRRGYFNFFAMCVKIQCSVKEFLDRLMGEFIILYQIVKNQIHLGNAENLK